MRKIFYFTMLMFVAIHVYGQWGVKAGSSFAKFTANGSTMGIGFYMGAFYDIRIATSNLYLRPGLVYHYDRADVKVYGESHTMSIGMHYFKLPLNISYHIRLNDSNYLNPYIGAYMYCGLFGQTEDKYTLGYHTQYDSYKALERFNYGLTGGLEYELKKHYLLNIEYNLGLNHVNKFKAPSGHPDYIDKLNTICLGLGYKF